MTQDKSRIITTLRERRAIEAAIRELGHVEGENELRRHARRIARQGDQVLPAVLAMLDTSNPQVRTGLGWVAVHLHEKDPHTVVDALRAAALDRQRGDQARVTAITLLERFLQQPPDETLYAHLANPQALMLNSLHEVLAAAQDSPFVYLDYLKQLEAQPLEVAIDLIDAMNGLEPVQRLDLLHLLAQDPRELVAVNAIHALGRIRLPQAAHTLQLLQPVVSPLVLPQVARSLRKLQLSGVASQLLREVPPGWRALVSAMDGHGNYAIWFIAPAPMPPGSLYKPNEVDFIGIVLSDDLGVRRCFANATMPDVRMPAPLTMGTLGQILIPHSDQPLTLLEVPFDYARILISRAAQRNVDSNNPAPYEYRLLNQVIWQFAPPQLPALPDIPPMPSDLAVASLRHQSTTLLAQRVFSTWFLHSISVYDAAEQVMRAYPNTSPPLDEILMQLVVSHFNEASVTTYRRRLQMMVGWLALAGDLSTAALARHLATSLREPSDLTHPFFFELAFIGVERAIYNLRAGYDLRAHPEWL